jgi:ribosomal protein S24E
MKIEILSEKDNPLLKRKEVLVSIDYNGKSTISRSELQKMFSDQFKADITSVEISKILSEGGLPMGKAWIKLWKNKKVPIYSEEKKGSKPAEEKPKEDKKE